MAAAKERKTVLITGCSSGIGESLAKEFHSRGGYHVIATARKLESLKALESMGMSAVRLDVTSPESIAAAKTEVETLTGGKLDILVNNAGYVAMAPLIEMPLELVDKIFRTNVYGALAVTQAFARMLVDAAPDSLIINVSSISSLGPFPFHGAYAMTKAALNSYSRNLSFEIAPLGVKVMTVVSGYVSTAIDDNGQRDIPRLADSLFASVDFEARMKDGMPEKRMDSVEYAQKVVSEVEKGPGWELGPLQIGGRCGWLYLGTQATGARISAALGERWFGWMIRRMWGFNDP